MTQPALPLLPAIDRKLLTRLLEDFDGDRDSLAEVLREYRDDAAQLLVRMQQAVLVADVAALGMAAHTLKSTSASIGATALAALCAELSRQTRGDGAMTAADLVARIATEHARVHALLVDPSAALDQGIDVAALLQRID